jgi:hypothetical protein
MVLGSIVIGLGGVRGPDRLSDYERTTGAAPTPIVTPASYVVWSHGKDRDRSNVGVV